MGSAYAIGAQAFAIGLLALGGVRTPLQYTALVWGVLFAVAFGWAWLPPYFAEPLLHRLIVTMAALAAMVIVYGFGLVKFLKRDNDWIRAAARLVPPLAGITVILVLVVVTMPWLFRGWFLRFWPLIVMAIAFVGVGLGEVFQRRRQRVLSEPLQTTGALLPLLPALGFWILRCYCSRSAIIIRQRGCGTELMSRQTVRLRTGQSRVRIPRFIARATAEP